MNCGRCSTGYGSSCAPALSMPKLVLPHFMWRGAPGQVAVRTRWRNSANPARPNIVRSSIFSRPICPSTGLVDPGVVIAPRNASLSRSRPTANYASGVAAAAANQASRLSPERCRTRSAKRVATATLLARSGASTGRRSRKRRSSAPSVLGSACRSHAVRLIDGRRHRGALVEPGVASSTSVLARRRLIAPSRTTRGRMSAPARISPRASSAALRQPARQRASR